jgi:hypothetical protein
LAYLAPHFTYDIFLSYSHGEVQGIENPPLKRWSQAFIDRLRADILSTRPDFAPLNIFDDRDADRTMGLSDQLKDIVEQSGLLLIVMSLHYLESLWCTDERDWFVQQFAHRHKDSGRVFIVRSISTDEESWPGVLKDSRGHTDLGFRFHPVTAEIGTTPYGWPDLLDKSEDFYKALAPLRTSIIRRLQDLKRLLDCQPAPQSPPPPGRQTPPRLYLHSRQSANGLRVIVSDQLKLAGCIVIDPVADVASTTISALHVESQRRIQLAKRCDALTLLRTPNDPSFDDELIDIAFDELERINKERSRPIACAVLDGGGSDHELVQSVAIKGVRHFPLSDPAWPRRSWHGLRIARQVPANGHCYLDATSRGHSRTKPPVSGLASGPAIRVAVVFRSRGYDR